MGSFSVIDEIKSRWKSACRVSSSSPNDIGYKLEGFLNDNWNFFNMFSTSLCNQQSANLKIPPLSNIIDGSNVSGYCSRTSSSVSDISAISYDMKIQSQLNRFDHSELSVNQMKTISIFFSSLSTTVIICGTPCRLYRLDDIYELGLREASNNILDWNKLGDGVLFVQFEKFKHSIRAYLCLANPDNCHLYYRTNLTSDSRLHSIRSCVRYTLVADKSGLTRVLGLYFASESRAVEFINKIHCVLDYISVNNQNYPRRGSNISGDPQVLPWILNGKPLCKNSRSLTNLLFRGWSRGTQSARPKISKPINFELTLHVPLQDYIDQ